jgi:two-component system sensor histidine kinase TctE
VPTEARPLVAAINHHMARHQQASEARRRFVDDASHQLRTPLTTLVTQADFALREAPPGPVREALQAMRQQLDEATRQVNQMLALARADAAELDRQAVDLVALARELTRPWWPRARAAAIDLASKAACRHCRCRSTPPCCARRWPTCCTTRCATPRRAAT